MLVFEDIHWADRSLLDLIELLAARLRDLPIMLLSLARPELLDSRPAWGGGLPAYTALPLAAAERRGLPEAGRPAAEHLSDEAAARLAETAEGNPLFIEQLAATLAESSGSGDSLPTTVRGIVAARLDALPASSARCCSTRRSSARPSGAARSSGSPARPTGSPACWARSRAATWSSARRGRSSRASSSTASSTS